MLRSAIVTAFLALAASGVQAQCGSGSPEASVTGSTGSYRATRGGSTLYSGSDYLAAIQTAVDSISSGQRIAVMASGDIGLGHITVGSGKIFEGCGTINAGFSNGHGAIESLGTTDTEIRYLSMTGNPYFGMLFYGTRGLRLGEITMNLSGGLGIRFHRDEPMNYDVSMGTIRVTGASSHAVETWNIDGLTIDSVIARNVGECGLLIQTTTNARIGLVDGDNVAAGNGYATFRMANRNGRLSDGSYNPNVYVDKVVSRGGGRGIFCVSESGGAVIQNVDLASNGNNAVLIENCYNVAINGGTVNGGGEVRVAARTEFANTRDVTVRLQVNNNRVRESPCGENIRWYLGGNPSVNVCGSVGSYTSSTSGPTPTPTSGGGGGGGGSGDCSPMWGQCGGQGYTGPTCCSSGTCTYSNEWYSQCI